MTDWKKVIGSQKEQPEEFDIDSSPTTVFQRRNIVSHIIKNKDGSSTQLWKYEERKMTKEEYKDFLIEKTKADIDYLSVMTGIEL